MSSVITQVLQIPSINIGEYVLARVKAMFKTLSVTGAPCAETLNCSSDFRIIDLVSLRPIVICQK